MNYTGLVKIYGKMTLEMCQSYVHTVFLRKNLETEPYVYKIHDRRKRSLISQFRCGILPLKVETGRFSQIPLEFRLCTFCSLDKIEDEFHFFFDCNFYSDFRIEFYDKIIDIYPYFPNLNNSDRLKLCMNNVLIKDTANFISKCVEKRNKALYN